MPGRARKRGGGRGAGGTKRSRSGGGANRNRSDGVKLEDEAGGHNDGATAMDDAVSKKGDRVVYPRQTLPLVRSYGQEMPVGHVRATPPGNFLDSSNKGDKERLSIPTHPSGELSQVL